MKGRRPRAGALLALAFISLVWGFNWVVMKAGLRHAGPLEFLVWRFGISSACLFGAGAALRRPMRLAHGGQVLLISFFQTTATFGLLLWALSLGEAGKSAMLNYTMPFWVVLVAWPALGERPSRAQWAALGIAALGLALILGPTRTPGLAAALALGSGLAWGIGVVITKRLQMRHPVDTLALTAWQVLLGGLTLAALAAVFPGRPTEWTPELVFAVVYNGVLVGAVCWFLWFLILSRLEAGAASFAILAVPILGALSGYALLGERPSAGEWTGYALIAAALALTAAAGSARSPRSASPREPGPSGPASTR